MNNALERICMEVVVAKFKALSLKFPGGIEKTTNIHPG
jgi:hypothetical protein